MRERLPSVPIDFDRDVARAYIILGSLLTLMVLGVAGSIAGAGLYILMMIQVNIDGVLASSLLFATSLGVAMGVYLYLTE